MKLRNKKTGEIIETEFKNPINIFIKNSNTSLSHEYTSLAELNEEWEDYAEPKEHWCVTMYGGITRIKDDEEPIDDLIEIGNYFNSKEDAYDAWDKLKAWKRLKDKGFVWQGWEEGGLDNGMCIVGCQIPEDNWETDVVEDLDLLFGEEEE